jgi:hypothetical protein
MSNQASRPRVLYNLRTGAVKSFPSGGAAKRAIELDPNWSYEMRKAPQTKRRRWWTLWLLKL